VRRSEKGIYFVELGGRAVAFMPIGTLIRPLADGAGAEPETAATLDAGPASGAVGVGVAVAFT
jgi:hypothetical protein